MYTYVMGVSRNGRQIYTNIIGSPAARYLSRQPYLVRIAKDMLVPLRLEDATVLVSHDLGHVIGNTNIVETAEKDLIYYARQPRQTYFLRFVKNRSMEPSSTLTAILRKDRDGDYELVNIWIGPKCPPFPEAADATTQSKEYWGNHALTAGSEVIDLQTQTSTCPY